MSPGTHTGRGHGPSEPVYQISSAKRSLSEDVDGRLRRYAISMGIRTVCLPLAVLTEGPLRWAFVVGAVILPYFAVVIANAGRSGESPLPAATLVNHQRALAASPQPAPRAQHEARRDDDRHGDDWRDDPPWQSRRSA